jgi:N-acetylmuramoyl-L-alanine amidase
MLFAAASWAGEMRQAPLGPHETVRLEADQEIVLLVDPRPGDAWSRLALRVTGDASKWRELARLNSQGENLLAGRSVRVPFLMLRETLRVDALRALFPEDQRVAGGWRHRVVAGSELEGESLWTIAAWFTGDGRNYAAIRSFNRNQGLSTRRGDWILIPSAILPAPFRAIEPVAVIAEDDPPPAPEPSSSEPVAAIAAAIPSENIRLNYRRDGPQPHAVYRLQQGEALYSSVGIRFTGRVYAKDVNEVVAQIVEFNGIRDVSKIPVDYPVKIPMDLLTAEWLPPDDPARVARERTQREGARLAGRVRGPASLRGVHIILDAGHGGRDVGTAHDDVWESTYVYDVACRLKKILETRTEAKVSMTTRSRSRGYGIPDRNILETIRDHEVLTNPRYDLEDPVVGVNLRWYLANSLFRRSIAETIAPERVIFLSIHADSLHPSLRGAMAYIPGERWVRGTYTKTGGAYLARAEVRESPTVSQSDQEALLAEGLSNQLASSVVAAFRDAKLQVHPYQPVRDNVVRNGREWVPAVIRYNKVPARLLLEVCNLGNVEDRRLMKTRKFRQDVAEAIQEGLVDFVRGQVPGVEKGVVTAGR